MSAVVVRLLHSITSAAPWSQIWWSFHSAKTQSYIHSPWLVGPRENAKARLGWEVTETYPLDSKSLGQRATEGTALCIYDLTEAY